MKRSEPVEHEAYRVALTSGRLILALSMLLSAAMHPETLTSFEMQQVVNRYHELVGVVQ